MAPKRRRVKRVPSDAVQGEGSWAIVAMMTVAEIRENRKESKKKGVDLFERSITVLKTHVREWNWVDDEGKPLPQPKDDPSVIEQLAEFETVFLGTAIAGDEFDAKN